jgi:hypothetical protein
MRRAEEPDELEDEAAELHGALAELSRRKR